MDFSLVSPTFSDYIIFIDKKLFFLTLVSAMKISWKAEVILETQQQPEDYGFV